MKPHQTSTNTSLFLALVQIIIIAVFLHGHGQCEACGTLGENEELVRGFDNALPHDLLSKIKAELLIVETSSNILQHKTAFFPLNNRSGELSSPRNFIELAIEFLHQEYTSSDEKSKIVGGEWWTQTKKQDQGLVFHYDKDEGYYQKYQKVVCPLISTITYLSDIGCPTLILNQTRGEESSLMYPLIPHEAFISYPKSNRHINFVGKLNHGIARSLSLIHDSSDFKREENTWLISIYKWLLGIEEEQRRTFLINWWDHQPDDLKCHTISDQNWKEIGLFYPKRVKEYVAMNLSNKVVPKSEVNEDHLNGHPVERVDLEINSSNSPDNNIYERKIEMMPRGDGFYFDIIPLHLLSNRTLYRVKWGENRVFGSVATLDLSNPLIVNTMVTTAIPKFLIFVDEDQLDEVMRLVLPVAKDSNVLGNAVIYLATPERSRAAMKFYGVEDDSAFPVVVVDDITLRKIKRVVWQKLDTGDIADGIKGAICKYLEEAGDIQVSEL